ncbi:hypothetical protein JZ751_005086 [Albula glossodonta]|uniref:C-type lectin domain-containing protein n=1 Tax=Albula glossodonta TaxID=121402 RepID=A0A8T2PDD9_9TELE|nr:hypothetical protein JZ751_005086 [Albula glossodonta]
MEARKVSSMLGERSVRGEREGRTKEACKETEENQVTEDKMRKATILTAILCLSGLSLCDTRSGRLENVTEAGSPDTGKPAQDEGTRPLPSPETGETHESVRGDGNMEEPEPTSVSDFENSYNYAIHKLNVGHYTLDVKMSQLLDRVSRLDGKIGEAEDALQQVLLLSKGNRKEVGRLEGCQKGRRVGYKCFLVYRTYESYAGAAQQCQERGGRMAMPRDRKEQEALADYARSFFHPGNWPVWLGINDQRSEGLYLFEDGTRVTYFQWRKHFLSSQPDGGKRENCVAMSSDDGDWWDNYCDRRMYYLCEFDA